MSVAHDETDAIIEDIDRELAELYSASANSAYKSQRDNLNRYESMLKAKKADLESGYITADEYNAWLRSQSRSDLAKEIAGGYAKSAVKTNGAAIDIINGTASYIYMINRNYGTYEAEVGSGYSVTSKLYDYTDAYKEYQKSKSNIAKAKLDYGRDLKWNEEHFTAILSDMMKKGMSEKEMAKMMESVFAMNEGSARRWTRTYATANENRALLDSYREMEKAGIKIRKRWIATIDKRTRDTHRAQDEEICKLEETFRNGLMYPGDQSTRDPSEYINCRCVMTSVIDGIDTSVLERNTKKIDGEMTYEEWKSGKKSSNTSAKKAGK